MEPPVGGSPGAPPGILKQFDYDGDDPAHQRLSEQCREFAEGIVQRLPANEARQEALKRFVDVYHWLMDASRA